MADPTPNFRPLPDDPSAAQVDGMFDANADTWTLARPGDYQTAAVIGMRSDGTDAHPLVALEWPGRINHTDEHVTVRLLIPPEDAAGLAEVLAHTARWMAARQRIVG